MTTRLIGGAVLGLVLGYVGAHLLQLQWATLIPRASGASASAPSAGAGARRWPPA